MRILITGATGFIGSHLCHELSRAGHDLAALVRSPGKASALPEGVEIVAGDLSRLAEPEFILPQADVVVHLAAIIAAKTDDEYWRTNYRAVVDLVECIGRQDWQPKRLVFASSLAAGGPAHNLARDEASQDKPTDSYGKAKKQAELYLADASFPVTSFRPAIVIGPRDPAMLTLFKIAAKGIGVRVGGEPQDLSFIDVDDLVSAIKLMIEDTSKESKTYYVCYPSKTDQEELLRAIGTSVQREVRMVRIPKRALWLAMRGATLLSKASPRFHNQLDEKQYQQMVAPGWVCNSSALARELGWQPVHDLQSSARKAAIGYRGAGLLSF